MGNQQSKQHKQNELQSYKRTEVQVRQITPKQSEFVQEVPNFQIKIINEKKVQDAKISTKENSIPQTPAQKLVARQSQKKDLPPLKLRNSVKAEPLGSCLNVPQQGNHTVEQLQEIQYDKPEKSLKNLSSKLLQQSQQKSNCGSQKQNDIQNIKSARPKKFRPSQQPSIKPQMSHVNVHDPLNDKSQIQDVTAF